MSKQGRPPKPKAEKFVRVTITLPPDLVARLKERAKTEAGGYSGLIAKALSSTDSSRREWKCEPDREGWWWCFLDESCKWFKDFPEGCYVRVRCDENGLYFLTGFTGISAGFDGNDEDDLIGSWIGPLDAPFGRADKIGSRSVRFHKTTKLTSGFSDGPYWDA